MSQINAASSRSISVRLFLTCWIVYCLHFATNFVREHYLALTIAERASFRMDEFLGFMPATDIIDVPGHGVHIGGNPGGSMIAAVSLAPFMPAINRVNAIVQERRGDERRSETPVYDDHRPNRLVFYQKVWEQGLDIKFGLIEAVTLVFCSAVWSALQRGCHPQVATSRGAEPGPSSLFQLFLCALHADFLPHRTFDAQSLGQPLRTVLLCLGVLLVAGGTHTQGNVLGRCFCGHDDSDRL